MTNKELRLPRKNPLGRCRCTKLNDYRISYFATLNVPRLTDSKTNFPYFFFCQVIKIVLTSIYHVPLVREFEFQSDSQCFLQFFFFIIWSSLALGYSSLFKFKDFSPIGWSSSVNFSAILNSWYTQALVLGNKGNK